MTLDRVASTDRIANLDVLRGIAILFILYMNIQYMGDFAATDYYPQRLSWTAGDRAAWWVNRLLDGTQRGLLEILFGAGILIMARAAMVPEGPVAVADLHMRRNLWLCAFGIAHGLVLLWPGDILFSYGTAALLIWPFRTLAVRWLLVIGIAITALLAVPYAIEYTERRALVVAATAPDAPPDLRREWAQIRSDAIAPDPAIVAAERADVLGPWQSYVGYQQRLWVAVQFTEVGIYWENVIEAFGTMLIGMALWKAGLIQGRAPARSYGLMLLAGYGIGLALRIPAIIAELRFDALPDVGMVTHGLARLPMTLGHVGFVTLALGTAAGRRLLAPFAATGRMPLSTYLGASLAAILVFGGPFGALWGRFGYGTLFAIATAIIVFQLVAANLWLRHFATGPAEWLWKSLAYLQRQPFRR